MPLPKMDFDVLSSLSVFQQADLKKQFEKFRFYSPVENNAKGTPSKEATIQETTVDKEEVDTEGWFCQRKRANDRVIKDLENPSSIAA